jgi:uncharacterized protein (DUF2267 family)
MAQASFLETVEQTGGITREEAERAVRATLRTLAERITRGQAEDIAAFLPRELRGLLTSVPEPAESFGLDEFVRKVAERERVDEATASRHVQAVFTALAQAVPPAELRATAAQLSRDFDPLLEAARSRQDPAPAEDPLVARVAELASLHTSTARRTVEAVLESLAVRISEGEVEDLRRKLPADLTPALERGLAESRKATRMALDEFLTRVAKREGIDREEAERRGRAVFAALREFVPSKEIYDVESELPAEYAPLFSGVV